MKKLAAILFLAVHLFSTNEVYQLMKLPVFFDHFTEHRSLTPDISLLEFLAMHYIRDSVTDFDHARDMQLPFKTMDQSPATHIPAFIPESVVLLHANSTQIYLSNFYIADESFIHTDFVAGIWQPPKYC